MPVYVEAVHTIRPLTDETFDAWVDWYGAVAVPAMLRNGFEILGAWKRTGGRMGQDVLLMRFEHAGAFDRAGASLSRDADFRRASEGPRAFAVTEAVKVAIPTRYAGTDRLGRALDAAAAAPRQYQQTVLDVAPGRALDAHVALAALTEQRERTGVHLVAAYETSIGERRGEITNIWVLPGGVPDLGYRAAQPLGDEGRKLRDAAPEESTYYLNPLPFSPLQ